MNAIDAESEVFIVAGQPVDTLWKDVDWAPTSSTVVSELRHITNDSGYDGSASISIDQELFEYSYRDHFGNATFRIRYSIQGSRNPDWTEFFILPIVDGGGNVDGSTHVKTDFDSGSKSLIIHLVQAFNLTHNAKETRLQFDYDDDQFILTGQAPACLPEVGFAGDRE